MQERLQKILSKWGIASRRHAEDLIKTGRVRVNGKVAQLGQLADAEVDEIALDGRVLASRDRPQYEYFLLNKPLKVVTSCFDPQGRKTVLEFLPKPLQKGVGIHPVGRLDYFSTGALLLTNDGELTYQLTHPRYHISKTYRVRVTGNPSDSIIRRWQEGILLSGQKTSPAQVKVISESSSQFTDLEVVMWEGRNRQIRRVAEHLGHPVQKLHRLAIGPIKLGDLAPAHIRKLSPLELAKLKEIVDQQRQD